MPRARLKFASTCEFPPPWVGNCVWIWDVWLGSVWISTAVPEPLQGKMQKGQTAKGALQQCPESERQLKAVRSFLMLNGFTKANI